jgi:hypothetical protein
LLDRRDGNGASQNCQDGEYLPDFGSFMAAFEIHNESAANTGDSC